MNEIEELQINEIINNLKKEYKDIEDIIIEDSTLVIFADDDTLWKILEDNRDEFNMEFEAGIGESHFIRILI